MRSSFPATGSRNTQGSFQAQGPSAARSKFVENLLQPRVNFEEQQNTKKIAGNMQYEARNDRNPGKPKVNNKFPMLHKLNTRPSKKKQESSGSQKSRFFGVGAENVPPQRVVPLQ